MKNAILFGIGNSIVSLLIVFLAKNNAVGDSYDAFDFMLPISAFLTGFVLWKLMTRNNRIPNTLNIVFNGLSTGAFYLIFAFVLIVLYLNLCYSITENCLDSSGNPPEGVFNMLPSALFISSYALIWFGWLSVIGAIVVGLIIKKSNK